MHRLRRLNLLDLPVRFPLLRRLDRCHRLPQLHRSDLLNRFPLLHRLLLLVPEIQFRPLFR